MAPLAPALALSLLVACGSQPLEPGQAAGVVDAAGAGTLVVDLVDGTSLEEARQLTGLDLRWATPRSADESLAVVEVADLGSAADRLRGMPQVEAAEPSVTYQATGLLPSLRYPDDPLYTQQWNLRVIGAPTGWRAGGGRNITVAVIDTGVSSVADLAGTTLLPGTSFVPGRDTAQDDNGHGTHVAGTIAQTTNNGLGVAGIAPHARILPLKVLNAQGSGRSEWIASASDEAVDQGADVINMSLGGSRSKVIEVAVEKAAAHGVVVVAAAGNTSRRGVGWPAASPGAIGVSATGPDDDLAFYSSYGPGVDLSAPGGDKRQAGGGILQDTIDSGAAGHSFQEYQGTSMASPHVAGAAAVLLAAGAGTPAEVRELLYDSARDLGEPGTDERFGHGRLDLAAAVRRLYLHQRGILALLGLGLGFGVALVGGMRKRGRVALTAAVAAGGLFVLPMLPLAPATWIEVLSRPFLLWPGAVLSPHLAENPLWISALVPAVLTFVFGPTRSLGWLAAGLSAGIGAHLLHGAITGSLSPTWLAGGFGTAWLATNGVLSVLLALAVAGLDRMRTAQEQR